MKQVINTLNISDFISKYTNYIYIYIYIILQNSLHDCFFVTEHSLQGDFF